LAQKSPSLSPLHLVVVDVEVDVEVEVEVEVVVVLWLGPKTSSHAPQTAGHFSLMFEKKQKSLMPPT
jgi:hypothetical protein